MIYWWARIQAQLELSKARDCWRVPIGILRINFGRWGYRPMSKQQQPKPKTQIEHFRETARDVECDEDQERFERKLGKIAIATSETEKSETKVRRHRRGMR